MSKLDNLLNEFDEIDKKTFNYNRDYAEVMRQLDELSFIAEIDKGNYYISMVEQVFEIDENGYFELITLTDEQRESFYRKRTIPGIGNFKIANSIHIYISGKEQYVQVFVSRGIIKELGDPQDDYGKVYTEYNREQLRRPGEKAEFKINELKEDDIGRVVLSKLVKAFELSKVNSIDVDKFDLKVQQDMAKHWGNLNNNDKLIDKEYQETDRPELIKIPQPHKRYDVANDIELRNIIYGTGFDEINYEANGVTRQFQGVNGANAVFYSIIDFVNNAQIPRIMHPTRDPQVIMSVEKHYLSGKWPIAKDEAESEELKQKLTKYEVAVTKFHDDIVVKLEVWEMGIVYVITNVWDARSIN